MEILDQTVYIGSCDYGGYRVNGIHDHIWQKVHTNFGHKFVHHKPNKQVITIVQETNFMSNM